jgi:hypothetical protein
LKKTKTALNNELKLAATRTAKGIFRNSTRRFNSAHKSKTAKKVLAAIKTAGWDVRISQDGQTTIMVGDIDKLDSLTAERAVSTGTVHHLWRIFHEGAGPRGSGSRKNPLIHGGRHTPSKYPFYVYVRTNDFLPAFAPGRHPPFKPLVAAQHPGVVVIYAHGMKGRQWYLNRMQLFREDRLFIQRVYRRAFKRALKKGK